jgi:prepilin-type N-terminal cleavage/methylation domain-containing protein
MMVRTGSRSQKRQRGFSLLETVVAAAVMLIGIGGAMSLFMVVAMKNASQGSQATRCTEYAQDKMEQLMTTPFASLASSSDTPQDGATGTVYNRVWTVATQSTGVDLITVTVTPQTQMSKAAVKTTLYALKTNY